MAEAALPITFPHRDVAAVRSDVKRKQQKPPEQQQQQQSQRLRKSRSVPVLVSNVLRLAKEQRATLAGIAETIRHATTAAPEESAETIQQRNLQTLKLKSAETFDEWRDAAIALDSLDANDIWKAEPASPHYNADLVRSRLEQLDEARISCDARRMLFLIRTSLTRHLGGIGNRGLYSHSHIGTKELIERYIDSARETIDKLLEVTEIRDGKGSGLDPRHVLEQILAARQSFGRSALLLSGGGTFGMNHIGVVKSLFEARLLPRIVSGSSAGSIVGAVLCTKADEEIPSLMESFFFGDLGVFENETEEKGWLQKAARLAKYGAIFDVENLVRVMRGLLGDLTFREAYNRTRRILNITVSSASLYELPRLLNYITAPDVLIWSAVAASCSVPMIFTAARLLAKDAKTGEHVPWNPSTQYWIDGSVDNDLPMTRLAELFNVNHFIVSQVNPHVIPFLRKEEDDIASDATALSAGPTWLNTMSTLAKDEVLHRMQVLTELNIFPTYFTKLQSVLSQKYSGDITIFPEIPYTQFPHVLSNPTPDFMIEATLCGERATWPKLSRIRNHCAIELALDEAVQELRARVVFSPSQVDLRQNAFSRSTNRRKTSADRGRPRLPVSRSRQRSSIVDQHDVEAAQPDKNAPRKIRHRRIPTTPAALHPPSLKIPGSPPSSADNHFDTTTGDEYEDDDENDEDDDDLPYMKDLAGSPAVSETSVDDDNIPPATAAAIPSTAYYSSPLRRESDAYTDWQRRAWLSKSQPATPAAHLNNSHGSGIWNWKGESRGGAHPQHLPRGSPFESPVLTMTSAAREARWPIDGDRSTPPTENQQSEKTKGPSTPEQRYKRLFHPPVGTQPLQPLSTEQAVVDTDDTSAPGYEWRAEPVSPGAFLGGMPGSDDWSGTRGLTMRKRSLSRGKSSRGT